VAALNISISGKRNVGFKLRAAIRKIQSTVSSSSGGDDLSSPSVADFFNSFGSHHRPVLLSIAALHRINVPPKTNIGKLRAQITDRIVAAQ
jgi:hypothetical protein